MTRSGNISLKLDAITARLLIHVAETWGVSEEETIRRALEQATALPLRKKEDRLAAFKNLQASLNLTPAKAAAWQDAVRDARC